MRLHVTEPAVIGLHGMGEVGTVWPWSSPDCLIGSGPLQPGQVYCATGTMTPPQSVTDWSNPNAVLLPGMTTPNGDTYAGAPTTVGDYLGYGSDAGGFVTSTGSAPATTHSAISSQTLMIAGGALLLVLLLRGRR